MTAHSPDPVDELPARPSTPLELDATGRMLLADPLLNKGMAFTMEERDAFDLHGLLPPHIGTLDTQVARRLAALRWQESDIDRYTFMHDLQDTNETLFYALLVRNLEELLPIVYTPTVGVGCERYSQIWRKPRGFFLSLPLKDRIRDILASPRYDDVRVIVVSDGERILGLGDQGAGGMGIPIGKLALYTACAGIPPEQTLPILLDVGTDNQERLDDPLYIGWRHARVRGQEYDDFIDEFISAVKERWPNVLLQWEDFARANAGRLLDRYRNELCTFNDDIQGTAAVATATVLAAIRITGIPLADQRIAILGAGSAGCGIGRLLLKAKIDAGVPEAEARRHFYAVDKDGLLMEGMEGLQAFQMPFAQPQEAIKGWTLTRPDFVDLADVVDNAKPTTLIGTSGQTGVFTEALVRKMAEHVERPAIFPLSNPTSRSEANPRDLVAWTKGRAIVGTGSPFPSVELDGRKVHIAQANNAYIFPGLGLGVLAAGATHISDAMFMVAAKALADASPAKNDPTADLLPPVSALRSVAREVALAVARQARDEGVAKGVDDEALITRIDALMWEPVYRTYRRVER
jgi:malate dehydrogenase (oxaloacetate-decarboxylating)